MSTKSHYRYPSSDKSNLEDSSLDEPNSAEDNLKVDNKRGYNIEEGLRDHQGGTIRIRG